MSGLTANHFSSSSLSPPLPPSTTQPAAAAIGPPGYGIPGPSTWQQYAYGNAGPYLPPPQHSPPPEHRDRRYSGRDEQEVAAGRAGANSSRRQRSMSPLRKRQRTARIRAGPGANVVRMNGRHGHDAPGGGDSDEGDQAEAMLLLETGQVLSHEPAGDQDDEDEEEDEEEDDDGGSDVDSDVHSSAAGRRSGSQQLKPITTSTSSSAAAGHRRRTKPRCRAPIACVSCRSRKSKCDQGRPCSMCRQLGRECVYEHSNTRRVWVLQSEWLALEEERDALKKRVSELERENGDIKQREQQQQQQAPPMHLSMAMPLLDGPGNVDLQLPPPPQPSLPPAPLALLPPPLPPLPEEWNPFDLDLDLELMGKTPRGAASSASGGGGGGLDEDAAAASAPPAPGRLLVDGSGAARYMGDSSGAAYYSSVLECLPSLLPPHVDLRPPHSTDRYQSWDSRPLPLATIAESRALPPLYLARYLIGVFYQHVGSEFYHWIEPVELKREVAYLYALPDANSRSGWREHAAGGSLGPAPTSPADHWRYALIYIAMALGAQHVDASVGSTPQLQQAPDLSGGADSSQPGMNDYFARANAHFAKVCEEASVRKVQVLSLAALFLLSASHRDAAYAYIGLAMRLGISLGLHHLENINTASIEDAREVELQRRLFWSMFCVDRLASCSLGRPGQLSDDEIQTAMPSEFPGMTSPSGLIVNIVSSRIAGRITRELYVPSLRSPSRHYSLAAAGRLLHDLERDSAMAPLPAIRRSPRSELLLGLYKNLVVIIITRPVILSSLRTRAGQSQSPNDPTSASELDRLGHVCVQAARDSARLLSMLATTGLVIAWSFFETHFAYNAGVILLLDALLQDVPADEHMPAIYAILEHQASHGNESAASCRDILIALDRARHHERHTEAIDWGDDLDALLRSFM